MLSPDLEKSVRRAVRFAREFRHEYATLEHLLLALIDDTDSRQVLESCHVDIDRLEKDLRQFLTDEVPRLTKKIDIQPTLAFQRALQRAVSHMRSSENSDDVGGPHVLAAMFSERESHALYFLRRQNVSRLDVVNYISHGIARRPSSARVTVRRSQKSEHRQDPGKNAKDPIRQWCIDLNRRFEKGDCDPLIGRDKEIKRMIHILSRRVKNNPLLIGDPGVGKTAIAQGIAARIATGKVPEHLVKARIYALDMGALLAGTRYRGDFEERMKSIIDAFKEEDHPVLFIDEIHTLIGAGATSGGAMDGANLIKPALSDGLRCIGATTYREYRNHLEKDRALLRRFQKIDVHEPDTEDAVRILHGLKKAYEKHHKVLYSNAAIRSAVTLSQRYINDRKLPDKAIDVIDEAGAKQRSNPVYKRKKRIGVRDIEKLISTIAQVPPRRMGTDDADILRDLEAQMKQTIFGQDEALHTLVNAVKLSRIDLRDPEKPIGCYLFAGPTGVGKTEASRQLARHLDITLNRFDMSEYMESHSLSRLIGAPPGYVGFEQGGLLTDALEQHPHCVLLLDEVEKAHRDIFNILLQMMDYGFLTDHNGKKVNCRNAIIIMTTNAGAHRIAKAALGFGRNDRSGEESEDIERLFSPEFRNRLDSIIHFSPLTPATVRRILDKQLAALSTQLQSKGIGITFSDEACAWLAEKGHDPSNGARPLQRLIQEEVKKSLADDILFGRLSSGGNVRVSLKRNKPAFTISAKKDPARPPSKRASKGTFPNPTPESPTNPTDKPPYDKKAKTKKTPKRQPIPVG